MMVVATLAPENNPEQVSDLTGQRVYAAMQSITGQLDLTCLDRTM